MATVPTNRLERELRKLYLQWLAKLPKQKDVPSYIDKFQRDSTRLISRMGGQVASLGALADFPVPRTLELSPHVGTVYDEMKQAAIKASITAGLNSKDAARQMLNAGLDKSYRRLERLARTETVSAYWKNSWDSVADLPLLVMVWESEKGPRTCQWCDARDGLVVDDPNIRDHPNGRCTLVATLRSRVAYKGTLQPDGSVTQDPAWTGKKAKTKASAGPTTREQRDPLSGKSNPAAPSKAQPAQASKPVAKAATPTPQIMSAADANRWGAANVTNAKSLPPALQEQINLYTGGGYKGTNRSLRSGVFSGYNGPIQREMVDGLDAAMKLSATAEDVLVSRVVTMEALGGKTPSALLGKTISDKGYLSTAVGGKLSGPGFKSAQVEMTIMVPKGTPAIWTRPLSQFKSERELLLDRGTKLQISETTFNERTGKWHVVAAVVK